MDSAARPEAWRTLRIASVAARHQSRGSCSAQPGCGLAKLACSSVPDARTVPCSSRMTARVPLVPTSMPRIGMRLLVKQNLRETYPKRNFRHPIGEGEN